MTSAFLLVEVPQEIAGVVTAALSAIPVAVVTEHSAGCCCSNCPWEGDHRTQQERAAAAVIREARPMIACEEHVDCPACGAVAGHRCIVRNRPDVYASRPHEGRQTRWVTRQEGEA
jgi:hypothetical protein